MYLDIGNNTLIDEKEIIAVVNVSDRFSQISRRMIWIIRKTWNL